MQTIFISFDDVMALRLAVQCPMCTVPDRWCVLVEIDSDSILQFIGYHDVESREDTERRDEFQFEIEWDRTQRARGRGRVRGDDQISISLNRTTVELTVCSSSVSLRFLVQKKLIFSLSPNL